ncbi:MAG TPA: patatin-like phospholipase family protein [Candidatus Sulfotelmatobacter sp.]|jgi:NTE family protein|nr:patatin-like phospholipase family protein [Candidatus Sulfotelmatobacter sp.]
MARKYPKIGLALGSGGAKGLAHIGVLKSLEKHNIPINYIAASSIGSLIGAHYARYQNVKKLEEIVFNFDRKKGIGLFDFTVIGGIIKGKKTEGFISEILENATFKELKIPLVIVATDFNTAQSIIFNDGNLTKAIRASIAVPTIFQPIFYLDKLIADGGLSNPVPVSVVSEMGADITIAVNLDHVYIENPLTNLPPLSQIPMHAVNILRHNLALYSIKNADIIITPQNILQIGLVGLNNIFNNEKALQLIQEGEDATDKVISKIEKQIKFYQKRQSPMQKVLSIFKRF